jgi:hypothetical protein
MADINRVQGPSGPPETPSRKDKSSPSDKFKEIMKVDKVREVDPEEQKKRKRPEEAEEEQKEEKTEPEDGAAPPPPPGQPGAFAVGDQKTSKVLGASAPPAPSEGGPATIITVSEPGSAQQPPAQPQARPPAQPTVQQPQAQQPTSSLPQEQKQPAEPPLHLPGGPPPGGKTPGVGAHIPGETQKGVVLQEPTKGSTSALDQTLKKSEEEKVAEEVQELPPPSVPPAEKEIVKTKKGEEKKTIPISGVEMGTTQAPLPAALEVPPAGPTPPYAHLHPQVLDLFERMAGVMTIMTSSGMTETTINLTAPQFASSVFFGTQIIIQTFTTAPHAFNIQLAGTPQAVALFQGNAEDLMAAFQSGNYNFRVNRLDTRILTEDKPLFKRRDAASGDMTQDQGQR